MTRAAGQFATVAVAAIVTAALAVPTHAAPVPLNLTPSLPDLAASAISITYDATTDAFTATSIAPLVYTPGPFTVPGTYNVTATIDASGNLVGPGTVAVSGLLFGIIPISVTASLTQFGYNPAGAAILEFLGVVTAQTNASNGFPVGTPIGIVMNTGIPNISFAASFDRSSTAGVTADNFAAPAVSEVPEPTTLSLLALGALGLRAVRRRR